jgi:hypothetical protein
MFILKHSPTYFWPVKVEVPVSGGKYERHTFDAEFRRLSQSRMLEIGGLIEKSQITDVELAREVLAGWKGVQDDGGSEVPYSEGARDSLLDIPLVAAAVVMAFFESASGAKRKN